MAEDKTTPILPAEVWREIGLKLYKSHPQDLLNIVHCIPLVSDEFLKRRTDFLFQLVLPILMERNWISDGTPLLDRKSILSCRGVSHGWSRAVKALRCFTVVPSLTLFRHWPSMWMDESITKFSSTNPEKCKKFIVEFMNRNPFVFPRLRFEFYDERSKFNDKYECFLTGVMELLRNFGNYVEYLELEVASYDFHTDQHLMSKILSLVPNLITFSYNNTEPDLLEIDNDDYNFRSVKENFPFLPKLQHLDINGMPKLQLHCLLSKHSELLSISVTERIEHLNLFLYPQPNLQKLQLDINENIFVNHLTKSKNHYPIKTLTINASDLLNYHKFIGLPKLFKMIEDQFSKTLISLMLNIQYQNSTQLAEESKMYQLRLPNLKHLNVHFFHENYSLDFILPLHKSLEEIYLCVLYNQNVLITNHINGQIIQFSGFERKMYMSNIWKLFPKLRKISIEFMIAGEEKIVYAREHWALTPNPYNMM